MVKMVPSFTLKTNYLYLFVSILGTVYQLITALPLSAGTRSTVEQFGYWFGPDKYPVSLGINLRGMIFGFFIGRIGFNLLTSPAETTAELQSITYEEHRNR